MKHFDSVTEPYVFSYICMRMNYTALSKASTRSHDSELVNGDIVFDIT